MKELKCMYCGKPISRAQTRWEYCHKSNKGVFGTFGTYRCDGLSYSDKGWNEAKKAQPFIFDNYLKEAEKLGSI